MVNKKRIALSIFCLLMVLVSSFCISACKKESKEKKYDIQFMVGEDVYHTINTSGKAVLEFPANPTQTGYEFAGWYSDKDVWNNVVTSTSYESENLKESLSVYAKFDIKKLKINFENTINATNPNDTEFTVESSEITLLGISKDGYTFKGWYDSLEGGNEVKTIPAGSIENVTVYARWDKIPLTITYENTMGATNPNDTNFNVESSDITLSGISRDGYTFKGWYDALEGGNEVTKILSGSTESVTVYARWEKTPLTISYENTMGATNPNDTGFDVESSDITLSAISKNGYKFLGWYDALEGGNEVTKILSGSIENVTVYARWDKIPLTITYENTKDVQHSNPESFDVESSEINLAPISKECFIFLGWYDALEGGNEVKTIPAGSTESVVVYARWMDYVLTISYNTEKLTMKDTDEVTLDLFDVTCTDNNSESIDVNISYEGTITAGKTIKVTLTATSNGVTETVVIESVEVYGTPSLIANGSNYLYTDDDLSLLFRGTDSFGKTLVVILDHDASQIQTGNTITITATTKDCEGNQTSKTLDYTVLGAKAGLFTSNGETITGLTFEGLATITHLVIPYELNGTVITTVEVSAFEYNKKITALETPGSIRTIGSYAFYEMDGLVDIVLGEGLKTIGQYGFAASDTFQKIVFPNSFTTISKSSFENCDGLREIVLGENVNYMGRWSFARCYNLVSLTIKNPKIDIRDNAFRQCSRLKTVNLPEGMKSIAQQMFYQCTSLENITLPSTIESIGVSAFSGCTVLRTIHLPLAVTTLNTYIIANDSNLVVLCETTEAPSGWDTTWNSVGAPVYYGVNSTNYYNDGTFEYILQDGIATIIRVNQTVTSVEIPSQITVNETDYDVTTIGKYAFANSSKLKYLTIPSTITTIGENAFKNNEQLTVYCELSEAASEWATTWYGNAQVQYSISEDAHYNDGTFTYILNSTDSTATIVEVVANATRVKIPASIMVNSVPYTVNSVTTYVFRNMTNLESVYIPIGITPFANMFTNCSNLIIYCEAADATGFGSSWNSGRLAYYGINETNYYADEIMEYIVVEGEAKVTKARLDVIDVTIPSSIQIGEDIYPVTTIGESAFQNCTSLVSVILPDTLKSIGNYSFRSCTSLTSIILPEGFETLGSNAFRYCISLASVDIPSTLKTIGNSSFEQCYSLKEIDLTSDLQIIAKWAFYDTGLTSIVIPSNVKEIVTVAFDNCAQLKTIFIPTSVTAIGENALGSNALTIYYEGETIPTSWNSKWNRGNKHVICDYKNLVIYDDGAFTYQLVDGKAKIISADKFANIMNIPTSVNYESTDYPVVEIADNAFYNFTNLYIVSIPATITKIGSYAFYACPNLRTIDIPEGVEEIGANAFLNCSALTSITIPDTVLTIGASAFSGCTSLKNIIIPEGVEEISASTFSSCSALTEIIIPNSVLKISASAFSGCTNLKNVNIPNGVEEIGANAFLNCSALTSITIPTSVLVIGADAFKNCSNLTINCYVEAALEGWDENWNSSGLTVNYNYSEGE